MAVSKRLRYEILRRDNRTCRMCGASAPDVRLTVDHVTPVALGGIDAPANLATLCEPCNNGKSSTSPDAAVVADVSDDALRWSAAVKQAAENLRHQQRPKEEYRNTFLAEWNRWHIGNEDGKKVPLPADWKQAIERFRVAGIPEWMWADIVDVGMANQKVNPDNTFRYCCGVAWNKVTEIQAEARRLLATPRTETGASGPIADAIVAVALAVWTETTGEEPQPEQREELQRTTRAAHAAQREAEEIVRAARQAAYYGNANVEEGFEGLAHDEQFQAYINWQNAWMATGELVPDGAFTQFWQTCERLYAAGVGLPEVRTAAFVAGYHRSVVPHFGIPKEVLRALDIHPVIEWAADTWKRSFYASAGRWPTGDEERKFRAQLDRLTDCGYRAGDALSAAVSAGAAQEADIYWNIPNQFSALFAAVSPAAGGEV